jgi:uncharacterized protein (TIGR04552 family)
MAERSSSANERSVFLPGQTQPFASALARLSLQDVHEIRLLLRGDSVVDWHRLGLRDEDDVVRLLRVNGIDPDRASDRQRVENVRARAVAYIRDTLGLRLSDTVASEVSIEQLFLLASNRARHRREACTLLKAMHIIYHLDARELRSLLPIADNELFSHVEQSVVTLFDELASAGVPVKEFAWSRKTRDSLITKLLVKRESNAAQVFDRLRFRVVVDRPRDLIPTLHVMLQRFIPYNFVVPGQTVNTLVDTASIERRVGRARDFSALPTAPSTGLANEFSGREYQILNFVADLPVRVDDIYDELPEGKGNVVFVLAEFQVVDVARRDTNETGESSHGNYKRRQYQRVRERLLREPKR